MAVVAMAAVTILTLQHHQLYVNLKRCCVVSLISKRKVQKCAVVEVYMEAIIKEGVIKILVQVPGKQVQLF